MQRVAIMLSLALWIGAAPVWAQAPPPKVIKADGARDEFNAEPQILGAVTLKVNCLGRKLSLKARATNVEEEFMVAADAPELVALADALGAKLTWQSQTNTLVCTRGEQALSLKLGETKVSGEAPGSGPQRAELPVAAQLIDNKVHVPLSVLEDFLDVRVTYRDPGNVWVEPLIRNVRLEGSPRKPTLSVEATGPVSYKTFTLKNPDRFVIDVKGGVLDTPGLKVHHPELGDIRLGQFELGPATSRIVIPTGPGVSVGGPRQGSGPKLGFALNLPGADAPAQNFQVERITAVEVETTANGYRLQIGASGPLQYEWQRWAPPDNRFIVDIPQAVLAGPKQEFDVDNEFVSGIRVSQFQAEPPVVRLVIDLKRPAETRFTAGDADGSLALEIRNQEIDATMAASKGYGTTGFPATGGIICIDPGHGGSDPGAINRALGVNEASVTLDISKRLAAILKAQGWNVIMTRTTDKDVSYWGSSAKEELGARVKIAGDMNADLFLSIHCNASASPSSNGTSLHYFKQSDYVLAQELQGHVLSASGRANRGLQANRFYVLAHSKMPAVLVETAFLTNPQEGALLADPAYRQKLAEAIANGLRQYAGKNLNWAAAGR